MNNEQFSEECLREHNKYRCMHGVKALKHSQELDKTAQEWADQLIVKDHLENSPLSSRGEVGENISSRTTSAPTITASGTDTAKKWYDDVNKYDFAKGTGTAGHFTQLIWKSSEEVGFGVATLNGKCVVVAHYRPPGNVKGSYSYNVPPVSCGVGANTTKAEICGLEARKVCPSKEIWMTEFCAFKIASSHVRTDSMSSDEHFELGLIDSSDCHKAHQRYLREFIRQTISAINKFRVLHNVPILKHNKSLDDMSQKWAEELITRQGLVNSGNRHNGDKVGESIASRLSTGKVEYKADEVAENWYNEHKKYNFDEEPADVKGIGNFTQMLWKSTKEIGIGKAYATKGKDNRVIIVCNYYPAGNVLKKFRENVPPVAK